MHELRDQGRPPGVLTDILGAACTPGQADSALHHGSAVAAMRRPKAVASWWASSPLHSLSSLQRYQLLGLLSSGTSLLLFPVLLGKEFSPFGPCQIGWDDRKGLHSSHKIKSVLGLEPAQPIRHRHKVGSVLGTRTRARWGAVIL